MQPGTVLANRYRIEHKLGHGGMGSVYAATDVVLARSVAVKIVHASGPNVPELLSRFALEARAVGALVHPHIAGLHDFHPSMDPAPFLVMERIDGESLRAVLTRDGRFAVGRAVTYARQMLAGLAAAHARGTIHRDIKPSNVMLARAVGVPEVVKLVDFGIARMADNTPRDHQTDASALIGTPQYMAPEQAAGVISAGGDLYATALVLYEMLTGRNPFAVGDTVAVLAALRTLVPAPVSATRPDVPPQLDAILARALSKSPAQRYATAAELDAALATLTDTPAAPPHPATWRPDLAAPTVLGVSTQLGAPTRVDRTTTTRGLGTGAIVACALLVALPMVGAASLWILSARRPAARSSGLERALANAPKDPKSQAMMHWAYGDDEGARDIAEPRVVSGEADLEEGIMLSDICKKQRDADCVALATAHVDKVSRPGRRPGFGTTPGAN